MTWLQYELNAFTPEIRHGHTATSVGSHLVVFGGWEGNKPSNEVIILKNIDFENKETLNKE